MSLHLAHEPPIPDAPRGRPPGRGAAARRGGAGARIACRWPSVGAPIVADQRREVPPIRSRRHRSRVGAGTLFPSAARMTLDRHRMLETHLFPRHRGRDADRPVRRLGDGMSTGSLARQAATRRGLVDRALASSTPDLTSRELEHRLELGAARAPGVDRRSPELAQLAASSRPAGLRPAPSREYRAAAEVWRSYASGGRRRSTSLGGSRTACGHRGVAVHGAAQPAVPPSASAARSPRRSGPPRPSRRAPSSPRRAALTGEGAPARPARSRAARARQAVAAPPSSGRSSTAARHASSEAERRLLALVRSRGPPARRSPTCGAGSTGRARPAAPPPWCRGRRRREATRSRAAFEHDRVRATPRCSAARHPSCASTWRQLTEQPEAVAIGARAPSAVRLGQQPEPLRALDRLGAVADLELAVQRARVLLDRVRREEQRVGDLGVGRARGRRGRAPRARAR